MKKKTRAGLVILAAALALFGGINIASGAASGTASPVGPPDPTPPPVTGAVNAPAHTEDVFVPVDPCRIVDTRAGGGILNAGSTRSFFITGTSGFIGQGGKSGGCGIPASAKAITFSITSGNTTGNGRLTAYPSGSSVPPSTTLTYHSGAKDTASGTVKLGTGGKMSVANFNYKTDIAVDVAGYFVPPIAGMVAPNATLYNNSGRLVSAVRNSTGNFTVTVDTDVTYCTPTVTGYSGYVYASAYAFNTNKVQVYVWYLSGSTQTAYDGYFYLNVVC
ncbi:hypothetical protein D1871_04100 [Nakamurella silvestris]|nr:hypothetical protein D1871_04100 [Nakamurella silvestris]